MAPKSMNLNGAAKSKSAAPSAAATTSAPHKTTTASKEKHTEPTTGYIVRPTAPTPGLRINANPTVLKAHGVANGDLVKVWKALDSASGGGSSGASAVGQIFTESETESIDSTVLQLSFGLRGLLGVFLGDRVRLEKYRGAVGEADKVDIASQEGDEAHVDIDEQAVLKVLQTIKYVSRNQIITTDTIKFRILEISTLAIPRTQSPPPQIYKVSPKTEISVLTLPSPASIETASTPSSLLHQNTGYANLGGLAHEISLIRKTVDLPLLRPEIFSRFKVPPPRGILLHGPSGTGKTSLLRAIAHETPQAHILSVSASSILGRYLGDSEAALTKVFDEARMFEPSVILIDELDSVAPRRDSESGTESEARIVSTLVSLFDSFLSTSESDSEAEVGNRCRVVVVAATNRLSNVDPALRRPGRFDREIELRIPDASARNEILSIQLRNIPHTLTTAEISAIASKTHGFVGADIAALVREAVMCAVSRGDKESVQVAEMFVDKSDFDTAMLSVRASAMREIFLETPKVYWSDIGGQELVKQKLRETVEWPLAHPETFKRLGIAAPRGILLYGPPGCSKTLTAKALATEAGLNFLSVKGPEIFNKYVGESEKAIREIFRKARNASPSIIFFDEIDAISAARGHAEVGGDRVLTSLLTEMDGVESMGNVMVLAATNRPEIIDDALLRPGRIDRMMYVGPPDLDARKKILEVRFRKMSIADDVSIEHLAEKTDGCSGAELTSLCQEAGLQAMNEDIESTSIAGRHFEKALEGLNRSISKEMIEFYESFKAGISRA
ncbi:P-loop containing nucleoside triphosphate hydrolase protein [Myxozyma melibiosi]|uniref:P-loop containing nucleoside triphosphate hydrolase protein n=1 Tax=Myxozyma melibiosi TaxID=54550 RepID=A0ABR1EXX5_9ASCO